MPSPIATVVYYPLAEGHLAPDALAAEFQKLGRNDPLWCAFMQLIQQRLANAIVAAAAAEPSAAGRLEELLDLQRQLAALRAPARPGGLRSVAAVISNKD
jgi:hypothetical protein